MFAWLSTRYADVICGKEGDVLWYYFNFAVHIVTVKDTN